MQMRFGSSPGQSQKGFKKQFIWYKLDKVPGDYVYERAIIGTQKHLSYHPGLNVYK